jgi:hypothetical protein
MSEMGNYCKAYHVSSFRKFGGWKENTDDLRGEKKYVEGKELIEPKSSLEDDDILYLQENYVVTHGIFKDEHIVYDEVTDEWKDYCHKELEFEIPDYAKPDKDEEKGASSSESADTVPVGAGEESESSDGSKAS